MDELFNLNQACEILKINNLTIRKWSERGLIELVRLPTGRLRIKKSEINRIINGDKPDTPIKEEVLTLEQALKMVFDQNVIKSRSGKWVSDITYIFKKENLGFTSEEIIGKLRELIAQRRISDIKGKGSRMVLLNKPKDEEVEK